MLKAILISLALLAAVDFFAFEGHYRYALAGATVELFHRVSGQNWDWLSGGRRD